MKTNNFKILILFILLIPFELEAKSLKRGVSENQFQFKAQMEALESGVGWYYNWANTVGRYLADTNYMEFVPMCWNANYNADEIRSYCSSHPEVKYLLGFNEPNFTNQANMTPAAAAAAWPAVQALAKELGLKLVAPALNYSPNPPYQDPTKWMDEFVALVGNDAFDYLAIHCYGGFGVLKELASTFHERYGKEVWVTEFCLWPNEGDPNSNVSQESQTASLMQMVEWLEKTDWIYRYAWFKAIGDSNASKGPNYGLLISGKDEEERELSQQGLVYLNLGDFNPDFYNSVNSEVAATDYIGQGNCLAGSTEDPECDSPIEITRFNAGAWLDYQFDVPTSGEYVLTLRVTGEGEPVRFDPSIAVYSVKEDDSDGEALSETRNFTLPGDYVTYKEETFTLNLSAGKQTLRIKDMNQYQPSGIHISCLKLTSKSGVDVLTELIGSNGRIDVYNLQGVKVKSNVDSTEALTGLPAGIYVAGGKKIIISSVY